MPDIPRTNPLKRRSDRPVGRARFVQPDPSPPPQDTTLTVGDPGLKEGDILRYAGNHTFTHQPTPDRRVVTTLGEGVVVGVLVLFAALGFGAFVRFVLYLFGA